MEMAESDECLEEVQEILDAAITVNEGKGNFSFSSGDAQAGVSEYCRRFEHQDAARWFTMVKNSGGSLKRMCGK